MADEIEKKFLLKYLPEELMTDSITIIQGYMVNTKGLVVRVRLAGDKAYMAIKGKTVNAARKEFEYPVPMNDAKEMLDLFCVDQLIEKTRYYVEHKGFTWEIDRFAGTNSGLVVAEIELEHVDQIFEIPDWAGKEVTGNPEYFNSNLILRPYSTW